MLRSALFIILSCTAFAAEPCRIEIVDKQNGWPVPLVELRSVHDTIHVSDNLGLIAIDEPELLNQEVYFAVRGHGYGVPKDGFGYQGVRTTLKSGGKFRIEVERQNLAKRLGRLTGAGLFAEGEKLGIPPLLPETGVFGCDSVLTAPIGDKIFHLWGDTMIPGYPLGIYTSSAATTPRQPLKKFEPPIAMPYTHFRDDKGRPRGVAPIPGSGPTWLGAMVSFPDNQLGATYSKISNHLDEYEVGTCIWDPATRNFTTHKTLWKSADGAKPLILRGHPVRWKDPAGKNWLLFGDPFPTARCPDDFESWKNPGTWEKLDAPDNPRASDGAEIEPHRGSIAWNAYRKRWVTIFTQNHGKPSFIGEIWYAESESPLGPWEKATKVLTHDNYTFYNPRIQTDLTPADAPFILFEGTYTAEFANKPPPTPRYNYNQILYRLDLDEVK
ncbi:hypothetical protein JIN84_18910 [Luteolibacter yonseiensis]|uniref:DUF4185 domain-containing protein n=1 Tax=Luteolibacter yonseiensis TaxID=1144680 RepID=A0A934R7E0_9BACT|nr:hypothetical protein [Luteolibacter yonseiensis]MBK1817697.1 hypothetical protein [Luteolibacter yonseiensis]